MPDSTNGHVLTCPRGSLYTVMLSMCSLTTSTLVKYVVSLVYVLSIVTVSYGESTEEVFVLVCLQLNITTIAICAGFF